MYRYYNKSGLDISTLSDDDFCTQMGLLMKIRDMEAALSYGSQLKSIIGL